MTGKAKNELLELQSIIFYASREISRLSLLILLNHMSEFIKTGSKKSDVSILEQVRYCANWLKTPQEREKKRNTALKGREERGEVKKRLTFPLVFISWSLARKKRVYSDLRLKWWKFP